MCNVKYNPDGRVNKYKARLEAKNYAQTHDINYDETFVSVAKMMTVCVLTIVETKGSHLHQMDVKNVFLQGDLEEQVYMIQPPGFQSEMSKGTDCRMNKSLLRTDASPSTLERKEHAAFASDGIPVIKV